MNQNFKKINIVIDLQLRSIFESFIFRNSTEEYFNINIFNPTDIKNIKWHLTDIFLTTSKLNGNNNQVFLKNIEKKYPLIKFIVINLPYSQNGFPNKTAGKKIHFSLPENPSTVENISCYLQDLFREQNLEILAGSALTPN